MVGRQTINLHTRIYFRDGPLLFPRGYRDWEKIVCMRKNAEINCLPQKCIWTKIVCRDYLCHARFGEFKKENCLHSPEWRKKLASAQSMVEKNSFLLAITIPLPPPAGEIIVLPLIEISQNFEGNAHGNATVPYLLLTNFVQNAEIYFYTK